MPLALLGVAAIAAFFLFKGGSGHAQTTTIAVMAGDELMPGWFAVWHSSEEQTKLFGPRNPTYWNLNGYFMFDNGSGGFDKYKPDWQVAVQGPQGGVGAHS